MKFEVDKVGDERTNSQNGVFVFQEAILHDSKKTRMSQPVAATPLETGTQFHTTFEVGKLIPVSTQWGEIMGADYLRAYPQQYTRRSYTGVGNNVKTPSFGMGEGLLTRAASADYADGFGQLRVGPNPRVISNTVCATSSPLASIAGLSNMCWIWGQFVDHELDLTKTNSAETANMTTPPTDAFPDLTIAFERSVHQFGVTGPRQMVNSISSFLDATNVYGGNEARANVLRLLDGTGKLKTQQNNGRTLLPFNTFGLPNASPQGSDPTTFFAAGDIRANENVGLTGLHTIFATEHNRLCDEIVANTPGNVGKGEVIYQQARRLVTGFMQAITYNEFLPALFGASGLAPYAGYDDTVDASVRTEFSTVGYRLGHTMVAGDFQIGAGPATLALRNAFFTPSYIVTNGVAEILEGSTQTLMNEINHEIVDDLRNFLFITPGGGNMLDLASLNIQRGRDHGIPPYNLVRAAYGLPMAATFADITSDVPLQGKLSTAYDGIIGDVDAWVAALCEDHVSGAQVGSLILAILVDQFSRIRDGDRYYFETDLLLTDEEKTTVRSTTLADVLRRNLPNSVTFQDDVFHV